MAIGDLLCRPMAGCPRRLRGRGARRLVGVSVGGSDAGHPAGSAAGAVTAGRGSGAPGWPTACGFTLLEMLVVLMLIAITVTAVSMTVAKSIEVAQVNAVPRNLAAALRYTRGQAIVKGKEQVIRFNLQTWSYQVPGKSAEELPDGMTMKIRTAAEEQIDADTWGLRFYPDGSSTGGRVTIIRGPREWHVNVNWLTGGVQVVEVGAQ